MVFINNGETFYFFATHDIHCFVIFKRNIIHEFLIPGIKWIGIGHISGSLIATVERAICSKSAGAVRCGTTTIPTSEVIIPLAII